MLTDNLANTLYKLTIIPLINDGGKAARCPELKSPAAAAAAAAVAAAAAAPFDCRLFEAAGDASPAVCFAGVLDLASS